MDVDAVVAMAASALLLSSALPLGLRDLLPASKIKSL